MTPGRVLLILFIALLSAAHPPAPAAAASQTVQWEPRGPWLDEIVFPIIPDPDRRLAAILQGEADILPHVTRGADLEALFADTRVDVAADLSFHLAFIGFNLRRPPLDNAALRRALASVIDRTEAVASGTNGYAVPVASFVPHSSPFHDPEAAAAQYDPAEAMRLLDQAGYRIGPGGVRIDPATGAPMRELTLIVPRNVAGMGNVVARAGRAAGVPIAVRTVEPERLLAEVQGDGREFDLFFLGVDFDRIPLGLYRLFHSRFDAPGGTNVWGVRDEELDEALEAVLAPPGLDAAFDAFKELQERLALIQPAVAIYTRPHLVAYRSDRVQGVTPMLGYGAAHPTNIWTPLNLRRVDGRPGGEVRWPLPQDPDSLNPLLARSAEAQTVLSLILGGLRTVEPAGNRDHFWEAVRWYTETWSAPDGQEATAVTYILRDDVTWHDGVPFTAHDIKFSMDFIRGRAHLLPALQDWPLFDDYSHAEVHNDYAITLYYTSLSHWHIYTLFTALPKHIWEDVDDWESFRPWLEPHPTAAGLTRLIGRGPFIFDSYEPGRSIRLRRYEGYWAARSRPR